MRNWRSELIDKLSELDSLTQYPSIPTYHELDGKGMLTDALNVKFAGPVIATEKVDGTNARIIVFPNGFFLIGSRSELLYASGDVLHSSAMGIVDAVMVTALRAATQAQPSVVRVLFGEVYGHKIGSAAKQYTSTGKVGFRLFDVMQIRLGEFEHHLAQPRERIAAWRDAGGQPFLSEPALSTVAGTLGVDVTPRVWAGVGEDLPTGLAGMREFLTRRIPATGVWLDLACVNNPAEGLVLRTPTRSFIAKARFADYNRVLRRGEYRW